MNTQATDKEYLTTKVYATEDFLTTRIRTHELYTNPKQDFTGWVLDHISWRGDETVLDVGCGAGLYAEPAVERLISGGKLISADLSLGMLADVAEKDFAAKTNLLNTNVLQLPLPAGSVDVVLANHMLYHVPDIPAAANEIKRSLTPGGYLIAATNGCNSMIRFLDEVREACRNLGFELKVPPSPARINFTLENGADILYPVFPNVKKFNFESALVFPEAPPVVAYINSIQTLYKSQFPPELSWEAMLAQVDKQVSEKITTDGEYRVDKITGIFLAQKEV